MLAYIVLIPGLLAAWIGFKRSPQAAFLLVYLPTLLLLPEYYRLDLPGVPSPTFSQAAAVGTVAAFFARGAPGYQFSVTDLLVFGFILSASVSEYFVGGYWDAQNLAWNLGTWIGLPYLFAKSMIEPFNLRMRFVKTIVLLLAGVAVVSVYEFRFGATPWRMIFDAFFPWGGRSWVTTFRWGFARTAGPYGHAILAGILMVVAFRLHRWLEVSQVWAHKPRLAPWLPFSQARLITLILVAGVIMTMVRGPWIAAILAAVLVAIGRSRHRGLAIAGGAIGGVVIGIPVISRFVDYVSVGREGALTVAQESAAYRWELLSEYGGIAMEKFWFGWGLTSWPAVPGMESIDNYYLLLLLMHGVLGLGLFVGILLSMLIRLLIRGLKEPHSSPAGSSLSFTLASIYVVYIVSVGTVYLGLQAVPMLFLITGWAEGYLRSTYNVATIPEQSSGSVTTVSGFRRVLA
ncbi:MAG: O-antigen ligase family protein [Pseudohongiella sp.]|nr:O-antigen ligase family protein [Pseudohongiella sp.]